MDKFKIIINEGVETEVDGIFYLYNSKYYFAYTQKEIDEKGYVVFHLVQVGKEIQNTPSGPLDTGYMIGMEISDIEEWKSVQGSITKMIEDKKNGTQSEQIQYLPQNMLSVLKVISSKTFRLAKNVVEETLKLNMADMKENSANDISPLVEPIIPIQNNELDKIDTSTPVTINQDTAIPVELTPPVNQNDLFINTNPIDDINPVGNLEVQTGIGENEILQSSDQVQNSEILNVGEVSENIFNTPKENNAPTTQSDVIIDYRAKFFEEQEKNQQLEQQIKELTDKLENVKSIIG